MTNINDLKAEAIAAKKRLDEADRTARELKRDLREAVEDYNVAAAVEAGITLGETIVVHPEWGWSKHTKKRSVVAGVSINSMDVVMLREVTKKNKVWVGRNNQFCDISKCEMTGETLVKEKNDE